MYLESIIEVGINVSHCCLCSLTVKDLRAKVSFSQQVKTQQIRPNYGRWRWSRQSVKPSWRALQTAPLWKDEEHAAARAALGKAPVAVQTTTTGDAVVQQLMFTPPGSDQSVTMTVYDASEAAVPAAMTGVVPRAAVIMLDGTDFVAPQLMQHLDNIAVMVYGMSRDVQRMQAIIHQHFPNRVTQLVWAFIKPRQPDPRVHEKYVSRCIMLVGDEAVLKFQVSIPP